MPDSKNLEKYQVQSYKKKHQSKKQHTACDEVSHNKQLSTSYKKNWRFRCRVENSDSTFQRPNGKRQYSRNSLKHNKSINSKNGKTWRRQSQRRAVDRGTSQPSNRGNQRASNRSTVRKKTSQRIENIRLVEPTVNLSPNLNQTCTNIFLKNCSMVQVPRRTCAKLITSLNKWKRYHEHSIDVNCDSVPKSFSDVIFKQSCPLLGTIKCDLYLQMRQNISFYNRGKLNSKSFAERLKICKASLFNGQLSIRRAATTFQVRSCDAINLLVGKKNARKKLQENHSSMLQQLKNKFQNASDYTQSTNGDTYQDIGMKRNDRDSKALTKKKKFHFLNQKIAHLEKVMAENIDVFKEIEMINDRHANAGDTGELLVLNNLLSGENAPPRKSFFTEEQLKKLNATAIENNQPVPYPKTPDFLFNEMVYINGKPVRWIDSKNCLIIPGLTLPPLLRKFKKQIDSYNQYYGPGLIIWHSCFFETNKSMYKFQSQVQELCMLPPREV